MVSRPVRPRLLASPADIKDGVRALKRACPGMAKAHAAVGDPPLRRWSPAFDGLVRIVVGQQLSTASAVAIQSRLAIAVDPLDAAGLLAASEATLRGAGLSAGKIATLRALAAAVADGQLGFDQLGSCSADDVRSQLTAIRGVGPWTADIYLMFCRGDADGFAPGDLALQIGAQKLLELDARPGAADLEHIAERWQPWRGVAARMLWSYYAFDKSTAKDQRKKQISERNGRG